MASPGTVISAEVSLPVYAPNSSGVYEEFDPRTTGEISDGFNRLVPRDSIKVVSLSLQPSVDDSTVLVTLDTQQITLPVYAPDASGTYQGIIDPRTTGEIDEGLTPSIPVDSFESVTIPTYYGDNQQFTIPVLPVYSIPFAFKVDTRNLAYSSYDYNAGRSFDLNNAEVISVGDLISTQTSGRAGSELPTSLGYNIGDTVPRNPMHGIGDPTATPSSGATVTSSNGDPVTSPAATVISSAVNQYTLPTIKGGTYNFQVSWGDGTNSSIDSWDHPDVVHTYATGGEYDISITGTFEGVMFSRHGDEEAGGTGNVDCLKLLEVSSWGAQTYLDIDVQVNPFHPLSTPGTVIRDRNKTTGTNDNASSMFDGCANWNDVSGQKPNFKYISDARHANSGFADKGGKHWGSSNNSRMFRWNNNMAFDMGVWGPEDEPFIGGSHYGMFQFRAVPEGSSDMKLNFYWTDANPNYGAYSIGSFRLADNSGNYVNTTMSFDTTNWTMKPNLYSLQASFNGLRGFDGDVSGLVVPGVKNIYGCFANNVSFTGKGVETWDTSTVEIFSTTFQNCDSFNKSVSHFTFGAPCSTNSMFFKCDIFNQSVSDWDVQNIISTARMFKQASSFNNGGQAWTNAHWKLNTSFSEMFRNSPFDQDVRKWILPSSADVPERFSMASMFYTTPFNRPIDTFEEDGVKYWDMSNCKITSSMFYNAKQFNQSLASWDVSNVTNMKAMFRSAESFNQPLNTWNVGEVTNMSEMFYNAKAFDGDLSGWDVSKNTTMGNMFLGASAFTGQGLNTWTPTSSLTNLKQAFYGSGLAANTDLGGWDVSGVKDFELCFYFCKVFTGVNLENWDVSSAEDMALMFNIAEDFNADISGWDVSNVKNMKGMFKLARSFNQDLSSWNLSSLVQNVDVYEIPYGDSTQFSFDYGGNSTLADGSTGIYSGIAGIFKESGMSKANLDATISGWCDNSNTPNGSTVPGGDLQLGTIPLNGTSETLDSSTITKMQAKNMTAKYTNGNFVY